MSNTKKVEVTTIDELVKHRKVVNNVDNYSGLYIKLPDDELFEFILDTTNRVYFGHCEFETSSQDLIVVHIENDKKVDFGSCKFTQPLSWAISSLQVNEAKISMLFNNCTFTNSIEIIGVKELRMYFADDVEIDKVTIFNVQNFEFFSSNSNIQKLSVNNVSNELKLGNVSSSQIKQISFVNIAKINQVNNFGLLEKFKIINSTVSSKFYLDNLCDYDFRNVTFENELIAIQPNINDKKSHKINAVNCTFNGTVTLSESLWSDLCFKDSDFNKLVIEEAHAVNMEFTNCKFLKTSKIYNLVNPIQSANFALSTIKGIFLFNGWNRKRLKFAPDAHINFSHIFLEPSGYLIIRDVNKEENLFGNFNFACANLLGSVVFTDVYAKSLDLTCATIVGTFNEENTSFAQNSNSNTYTKLKNEAIKKSSTSGFIEYRAAAMTAKLKELKKDKKEKNRYTNILLLHLNNWSNKNGVSWVRGVLFTMGVTFFFFMLITTWGTTNKFVWGWHGWDAFGLLVQQCLAVLNIVDLSGEPSVLNLNTVGKVIFVISKIFVGYGIYQTIAAFRKYGK